MTVVILIYQVLFYMLVYLLVFVYNNTNIARNIKLFIFICTHKLIIFYIFLYL